MALQDAVAAVMTEIHALADKGDARAQFNLALLYENGQGLKYNAAEALLWYRKAADQGMAEAQVKLGNLFSQGETTVDFVEAGGPEDYPGMIRAFVGGRADAVLAGAGVANLAASIAIISEVAISPPCAPGLGVLAPLPSFHSSCPFL